MTSRLTFAVWRPVVRDWNFPDGPNFAKVPTVRVPGIGDPGAIPRGNIAKFDDRWEWIERDMLPAFTELATDDPARLRQIVQTPIVDRADDLRLVPFE